MRFGWERRRFAAHEYGYHYPLHMIRPAFAASTEDVARHYDELDGFYRTLWGEHLHHGYWRDGDESPALAVRRLVDRVAESACIGAGSDVCDVGCGYGGTARMLARERGAHVVGWTLSAVQHDFAVRHDGDGTTRFVLGDWLENELLAEGFDAVLAIESTEHMADKPRFFAEAARVLRPGGRLVVCAWLEGDGVSESARRGLLEPICAEGRLPSMGTAAEYRAMIGAAGLREISFEDITPQVRRTWRHATTRVLAHLLRPSSLRYLLNTRNRNRVFTLTVPRIWMAYALGAMRYGIFTAEKPGDDRCRTISDPVAAAVHPIIPAAAACALARDCG